ncbi:MAG TPA: BON domain-containing protein [Candidatus Acidoferrales bacterium]|nr:BON domain-containing protein [Candidatus Acidoferrales bacterium]
MSEALSKSKVTAAVLGIAMFLATGIAAQAQKPPERGSGQYHNWLTTEVRHQLIMVPWLSLFDNLQYRVDGNNVTLSGQVTDPVIKDDAEKAVKSIEGVGQVTDNIEVLPLSPMDNQIRRAEYRSIYSFPSLEKYGTMALPQIHIVVKNGHVTLDGAVLNQADKTAADLRAKSVPNVFSVTDNLQIENSQTQRNGQ